MLMTYSDNKVASYTDAALKERKHELQNGLAAAAEHGVEAPRELIEELAAIQNEMAKRGM